MNPVRSGSTLSSILIGLALLAAAPMVAAHAQGPGDRESLLGVWDLVAATDFRPDGTALPWMGPKPTGTIIYTKDGRMAVQFMRDPPPKPSGQTMWTPDGRDLLTGTPAGEIQDAFAGYYAYFGTWRIDATARTVTHRVVSSLRPEEVGREYVRPYEFRDEGLLFRYSVRAGDGEARTRVIEFRRAERFQ